MLIKTRLLYYVTAVLLLVGGVVHAAETPKPADLFRQVEERFSRVKTLSYSVKRSASSKKQRGQDSWLFRYKAPDHLRIDYLEPHNRIIATDGTGMVEYIPAARKAMKTDFASLSGKQRAQRLASVMQRVSVDGLRLGDYDGLVKRAVAVQKKRIDSRDVWMVQGQNPRYVIYVDAARHALLKTEIYNVSGALLLRTEASSFFEAAPGFWLPREITADYSGREGLVRTVTTLREVRVDGQMDEMLFKVELPKGIEIMTEKGGM